MRAIGDRRRGRWAQCLSFTILQATGRRARLVPSNRALMLAALWSRSTLVHQRSSLLADLLKRHFEATKLLRAQFRKHSPHLPGMLSKGGSDEVLAPRGEGHDTNTPVFRALDPRHQAFREETVHSDTDRAWSQIDDWAYRIDGQRPFVQQEFQHAEIREAESGLFNTSGCVPCQGPHRLHHYQPDVVRPLGHKTIASGHKNLNLLKSIDRQFY